MARNILDTLSSKITIATLTLLMVTINVNYFGTTGVGTIGLIILCISILQLVLSFTGDDLFVRFPIKKIGIIYLLWTI